MSLELAFVMVVIGAAAGVGGLLGGFAGTAWALRRHRRCGGGGEVGARIAWSEPVEQENRP